MNGKGRPDGGTETAQEPAKAKATISHSRSIGSSQVSWWSVAEYVEPVLQRVGAWPLAGSVEWQLLDDDDPRKIAAIFDAARHHTLRVDTAQEERAGVSRDVSAAADWLHIARVQQRIKEFRAAHPWAKRVPG